MVSWMALRRLSPADPSMWKGVRRRLRVILPAALAAWGAVACGKSEIPKWKLDIEHNAVIRLHDRKPVPKAEPKRAEEKIDLSKFPVMDAFAPPPRPTLKPIETGASDPVTKSRSTEPGLPAAPSKEAATSSKRMTEPVPSKVKEGKSAAESNSGPKSAAGTPKAASEAKASLSDKEPPASLLPPKAAEPLAPSKGL